MNQVISNEIGIESQCPTDQCRTKIGMKAAAAEDVIERRTKAEKWPYKECEAEKKTPDWASGIVPQTEACYRAALDFTTLTNHQFDVRYASVSSTLRTFHLKLAFVALLCLLCLEKEPEQFPL